MSNPLVFVRAAARLIARVVCLCVAAAVIAAVPYFLLGPPSPAREYRRNEIARFSPTAGHGIGQLAGEGLLLVGVAYVGRRWLRIRL